MDENIVLKDGRKAKLIIADLDHLWFYGNGCGGYIIACRKVPTDVFEITRLNEDEWVVYEWHEKQLLVREMEETGTLTDCVDWVFDYFHTTFCDNLVIANPVRGRHRTFEEGCYTVVVNNLEYGEWQYQVELTRSGAILFIRNGFKSAEAAIGNFAAWLWDTQNHEVRQYHIAEYTDKVSLELIERMGVPPAYAGGSYKERYTLSADKHYYAVVWQETERPFIGCGWQVVGRNKVYQVRLRPRLYYTPYDAIYAIAKEIIWQGIEKEYEITPFATWLTNKEVQDGH